MKGEAFEVKFTLAADRDLDSAFEYYFGISPDLAARFIRTAHERARSLAGFWAHELRKQGIRKLKITAFPYNLYYRVDEERRLIRIISVKHERLRSQPGQ